VNKPKPKFSPKIAKVLGKIDANTRCIAKLVSAFEYAADVDGVEFAQERGELLRAALFELIQRRRILKVEFGEEWEKLNR
jgi:hypothetical protein